MTLTPYVYERVGEPKSKSQPARVGVVAKCVKISRLTESPCMRFPTPLHIYNDPGPHSFKKEERAAAFIHYLNGGDPREVFFFYSEDKP